MKRVSSWALTLAVVVGCSGAEPEPSTAAGDSALVQRRSFVEARSYFTVPEHIDAWYGLTSSLRQSFDQVCGDTFCEGEFSNYESLGFRCSVDARGIVGTCLWMFAASSDEVVPRTGAFVVDARSFHCQMPVAPGTRILALLEKLSASGAEPLFTPLPGTAKSLYDGLVECL